MAREINLRWDPDDASGLSRRDRQGCDFAAYLPDPLAGRPLRLEGETAADVTDAELAVHRLNETVSALASSEAIARLLLRAEAVASSRIEGLEIGGRRLLKEELARTLQASQSDVTATEVLNNIAAMQWAVDELSTMPRITTDGLLAVHRRLLQDTAIEKFAGEFRRKQNWIGGSEYNPCSAAFVPPPHEYVPELMADLCDFCNQDTLPAIAQAAIAHAQFETIHPFADGNGRTGRALIHVILRRRGLAPHVVPPVSLVLATWATDYVHGLTGTRYLAPADSDEAIDGANAWIAFFATACRRAVADAELYEERVREVQSAWRTRLGRVRKNSAVELLLHSLPSAPVLTARTAAKLIGRSDQAANEAIRRLLGADVLSQTTVGRRNRAFEAPELIEAFTALERQLASPDADTLTSPPSRRVPARR